MTQAMTTEPTPVLCESCDRPAVALYRWQHGVSGVVCQEHQFLINQTSQNAKQAVTFSALASVEVPLVRSERTQLIAAKLSAESEADEAKRRAGALYEQLGEASKQLKNQAVLLNEQGLRMKDLESHISAEVHERQTCERRIVNLTAQLEEISFRVARAEEAELQIRDLRERLEAASAEIASRDLLV
jgi:chromosome segregation ATPase